MKKVKKTKALSGDFVGEVIPHIRLTAAQQKVAKIQLAAARKRTQKEMSEQDRLELNMLHVRFQIENYLSGKEYDPQLTFGFFLKEYIEVLGVKRKVFAEAISIDETFLSQLINMHRLPPDYLVIRLEIHSNNLVPADYWLKLVEKQKQHMIKTDTAMRKKEQKYVLSRIAIAV